MIEQFGNHKLTTQQQHKTSQANGLRQEYRPRGMEGPFCFSQHWHGFKQGSFCLRSGVKCYVCMSNTGLKKYSEKKESIVSVLLKDKIIT